MEWKNLLSPFRMGGEKNENTWLSLKSPFEQDYHRIIGSASFRRLQDKTQVFPLDKSDFIRTRLTHSLEVSAIGRLLAATIGNAVIEGRLDPDFTMETRADMAAVVECAGLIHDIGNPPFGHFGEEAIREWFRQNLDGLLVDGRRAAEFLNQRERLEFLNFEGNAQALRVVSKLHFSENACGLNLTYALLSSIIKYPVSAEKADPKAGDPARKKMGYFEAETGLFEDIQRRTGTNGARNPLTFILEAADDISYATADIEDAFKKGFINYDLFSEELKKRGVAYKYRKTLADIFAGSLSGAAASKESADWGELGVYLKTRSRENARQMELGLTGEYVSPGEYALMTWLGEVQGLLLQAAARGFISQYDAIMAGEMKSELISHSAERVLLDALKGIAYDYAFTSMSIYKTEIAANNILTCLLGKLVPSVLQYDRAGPPGLMEEKYLSLVSENYKQIYHWQVRDKTEEEKIYYKLLLATDTVSGMTDSYARDLYMDLNGFG
ncbi:MAG: deoxyguanosinetriphosphate triphosphohydrolase [Lachnospiraceae bacterium]|nr:deoxyguanosinetriphosphate triphosphohydrolase [Lachnospiraceae bacterium]